MAQFGVAEIFIWSDSDSFKFLGDVTKIGGLGDLYLTFIHFIFG